MQRRKFSREFKIEGFHLAGERGVSVAQASREIDVRENVVRKWMKETGADPKQAFPGRGELKPEQLEIDRFRREVAKLKAERDILKKARPTLRGSRHEVRLHCEARSILTRTEERDDFLWKSKLFKLGGDFKWRA